MATSEPQTFVYKKAGNVEIPIDVFLPPNAKNLPVLLWFHGGGLLQSSRKSSPPHLVHGVTKYDYAYITADYRLAPQVGIDDIFEDVKDCIAFIRGELSSRLGADIIDSSRLAVSGGSAGGYLAFLAGLYVEPKPKVILPIYPITDPLGTFFRTSVVHPVFGGRVDKAIVEPFLDPNGEVVIDCEPSSSRNMMYGWMLQEAILAELLRIKPGEDRYRIAKNVHEHGLPPTYVVHGDADGIVGVEQSDEVVGVMHGLKLDVEYERLHGVDHLFDRAEDIELENMYTFMMKHI